MMEIIGFWNNQTYENSFLVIILFSILLKKNKKIILMLDKTV